MMSDLNTVSSNGTCNKCLKKVNNNDISCFICKERFHAVGCSMDIDICTQSFMNQFRPHVDKVSAKYAARPGNFLFMCNPCMTSFEVKNTSKNQNKVDALEEKVDKLESGLRDIKQLLLHQNQGNISNAANDSLENNSKTPQGNFSPWGKVANSPMLSESVNGTPRDHVPNNGSSAVLILPAVTNDEGKKLQSKVINKVAIEKKVAIDKSFNKKNGETVIVCNSRETRDLLKGHIEEALPDIEIKSTNNCKYTIAVVGFADGECSDGIIQTLIDQNYALKCFFADENIEDHMQYLDTKPLRNNSELFQATFRISKQLRLLMKRNQDRLIVGIISCKVYDRVFVKRCALCQDYGHYFAQCPCKDDPNCALCAGPHETKNCPTPDATLRKCVNCVRNKLECTNHAASSKTCPIFLRELEKCTRLNAASLN